MRKREDVMRRGTNFPWYRFTLNSEDLAALDHFRLFDTIEGLQIKGMALLEDDSHPGPERIYYLFTSTASNKILSSLFTQFGAIPCAEPHSRPLKIVAGEWGSPPCHTTKIYLTG